MATTYKNLGQQYPAATTETDLYAVPGATQAVGSSFIACNQSGTADTIRFSISVGGGATAAKDYLYYDLVMDGNDTFIATVGITMQATDTARVYSLNGTTSFSLWGSEIA